MGLSEDTVALRAAPLLRDLSDEQLRLVAFGARKRTIERGEVAFRAGRAADGGIVVQRGSLVLTDGDGEPVDEAGAGDLVNELALIIRRAHDYTGVARTQCNLIIVERGLFRRVLEEFPDAADRVQERIGLRIERMYRGLLPVLERMERAAEMEVVRRPDAA